MIRSQNIKFDRLFIGINKDNILTYIDFFISITKFIL